MPTRKTTSKPGNKSTSGAGSADALHTYEHFGRIEILEGGLAGSHFVEVNVLANLAQHQLDSGHAENAAILLRAAEHISFAALAPKQPSDFSSRVPEALKSAVAAELDRLLGGAQSRWSARTGRRAVIESIFTSALDQARQAFARGAYRPSLQLARAANTLTQIKGGLPARLPRDRELNRRLAS